MKAVSIRDGTGSAPFVSVAETSQQTTLSKTSVLRAIARGEIAATRVGARWLIPASEIDRLIASAS